MLSLTPAQKVALAIVVVVVLTTGGLLTSARLRGGGVTDDVGFDPPEPAQTQLRVHVVGAVNRPGMYRLPAGARVSDAIGAAGGMTANARAESVNLAGFVDDGQQVVVEAAGPAPSAGALSPASSTPQAHMVGGSAATPPPAPDAPVRPAAAPADEPARPPLPWPDSEPPLVHINTAGLEELKGLPGIGEELAMRILYYRHEHGPFRSREELLNVRGIGPETLEKMRSCITVQ